MLNTVLLGFYNVLSNPASLLYIFIGVLIGIIFGCVPGLTCNLAIVMFLPITYAMESTQAISILVALYIGGVSGGLISAILLNIPGTPSAVATCFDGHPLALKGQAGRAIGTGILASFFGTLIGIVMLVTLSPLLANVAVQFGPYEYCALTIFSLTLVVALTGKDMLLGFSAAIIGAMFATVGLSPIDSHPRFTLNLPYLSVGFKLLVMLIGLFAVSEVMKFAETVSHPEKAIKITTDLSFKGFGISLHEFFKHGLTMIRSAFIGIGIGILPGIGATTSAMMSYTVAKNRSSHPEEFGKGAVDGVIASETANNATIGGAMIPLLALGIPGDATTALLLSALTIHDVVPGPLIFERNGHIVYGLFFSMVISSFVMLVFERLSLKYLVRILDIPKHYMMPIILVLCVVGVIGDSNILFDTWGIVIFGLIGYLMGKAEMPLTPMILGFILQPYFEENLRKVSQVISYDHTGLLHRPIAIAMIIVAILSLIISVRRNSKT